jgi:hypothetical protein
MAGAVVLVWCAVHGWGGNGVLTLLPALVLGCVVHARCYPGERFLLALRREQERESWPRPRSTAPSRRRPALVFVHGGLLIARSLAVRPPPAPLISTS